MDDYYTMEVNNLICETLHPSNIVAKIHNSSYSDEDKQKIFDLLSKALKNKDSKKPRQMGLTITTKK